jgi:outer membrane protein OmpA-like peptidoglycan-associated protein
MSITGKSNILRAGATCLLFALLSACAQSELAAGSSGSPAQPSAQAGASGSGKTEKPVEQVAVEVEPDYQNMNPVPIAFDKMGVKLNDAGKQVIVKIVERARKSKRLVVTGYCDRKQVGNAHAAALARANAVRNELIHLGVKRHSIQLKTITNVADRHLAEIHFS